MTDHQKNELAALKVHEAAFAQSIATAEARGNAHPATIGTERMNLANIREKIAEIEAAEAPPKKK